MDTPSLTVRSKYTFDDFGAVVVVLVPPPAAGAAALEVLVEDMPPAVVEVWVGCVGPGVTVNLCRC